MSDMSGTASSSSSQLEDLLGPTLSMVVRLGPIRASDIAALLHRERLLPADSPRDAQDVVHGTGRIVLHATQHLNQAGLIEWESPRVFTATPAGQRLAGKQGRITFAELRKRPRYTDHLRKRATDARRRSWQWRRFDHYAGGRLLTKQGSFYAAPTILAYAIEYSLKAALDELPNGAPEKHLHFGRDYRHDLRKLYELCSGKRLLEAVDISADFFDYASEHFKRRYPSLEKDVLADRKRIQFGGAILTTYDDAMIQLDRGLDDLYGAGTWSLGNFALTGSFTGLSKAFFHDNVFAVDRLAEYLSSAEGERIKYPEREHLERPELLFACDSERMGYTGITYEKAQEILDAKLAARFVYPHEPQEPERC